MKVKFNLKILLLVGMLLIAMCMFSTGVNAAEVTQEQLDTIVPDSFSVSATKTEYANFIVEHDDPFSSAEEINDEVQLEIKNEVISLFADEGITLESDDVTIYTEREQAVGDLEDADVSIGGIYKNITIEFAKEASYNETDATYVKNKVDGIKYANSWYGTDALVTVFEVGDDDISFDYKTTNDFASLIDDDSIEIKVSTGVGALAGGTPWGEGIIVYFFKDNVLYETRFVYSLAAYGIKLDNGVAINMAVEDKESDIYKEMAEELASRGFTNPIICYDLSALGETTDSMEITFKVGTEYNGEEVQILHKKAENDYEIFKTTVENGEATITVDSLSPFMIALSDTSADEADNTNTTTDKVLDDEPKTGALDYIVIASAVMIISIVGIAVLKLKK